ncbi:murein DD-endopeptidase MepM/ murein hydrolase activator NlpD [Sphingomonas vulcanisoli]|uniref:Murein DD-endopeptidase MepM/ murein hydrolase activator NlpD n=1 Tax=Sphingomonas vulcanisoli TaxID=1658060 RepID=A0ABX0TVE5_9SPHN|nr:M23 family metallopeptidase [Sphingomonas vulcanisoli]NIJ09511.1 murein DD-endopeptidase MepM/ murein hydrolase activator NlpD [Sphingomonas vulcanisoli]
MMIRREAELLMEGGGGSAATVRARSFGLLDTPAIRRGIEKTQGIDLVVDLGARIGSATWWRGLATCTALCALTFSMAPSFRPLIGASPAPLAETQERENRRQAIAPQAFGADTGARAPATNLVERLTDTPERPQIQLTATLGAGDGFAHALERAGVGADQAQQAADLVSEQMSLGEIKPGTRVDLTLGRRPNKQVARPLDRLAFRAKLELALEVQRIDQALKLIPHPIAVDETPLRIQGRVGASLFAAARAAGAPAQAVQTYLRAMAQHVSVGAIRANDRFDLIVAHRRAATGETETGGLLYAGLDEGKKVLRLLKWDMDGKEQWFDAAGVGEQRGQMKMPVANAHVTSGFGQRFHPILGYSRMHQGIDYGAPMGSPIDAATDGVVSFSGWHGGHGNYVQIRHPGGMGTGYAHMSRILVHAGDHVRAGQIIGYVGSTGLSTGPHLHFEVFKNNVAVNPLSVKFTQAAQLAGNTLARFKATLAHLLATRVSG